MFSSKCGYVGFADKASVWADVIIVFMRGVRFLYITRTDFAQVEILAMKQVGSRFAPQNRIKIFKRNILVAKVITGKETAKQARRVCAEDGEIFLAVSYWGKGANEALKLADRAEDIHVVLNVAHGGTNPEEFEALMKMLPGKVCVHPTLHAKIYASKKRAVLGSANASAPGLNWGGTGHAEAAVALKGADARAALKLAKDFYKNGQAGSDEHLQICREQFGRRPLAATLSIISKSKGGAEAENPVDTFLRRSDVFGPLPVIISKGIADPHFLEQDWNEARATAQELPENEPYITSEWSYFQWHLDVRYRGKACLEIHKRSDAHLSLHLVQPICHQGKVGTFARRLSWSIVGDLGRYWHGKVRNMPGDEKLSRVHEALSEQDYLTGWDVYKELEALSTS